MPKSDFKEISQIEIMSSFQHNPTLLIEQYEIHSLILSQLK